MKKIFVCLMLIVQSQLCYNQNDMTLKSNVEGFSISLGALTNNWVSSYFDQLDEFFSDGYAYKGGLGYGLNQNVSFDLSFHKGSQIPKSETVSTCNHTRTNLQVNYNFGGTLNKFRPYAGLGYQFITTELSAIIDSNGDEGDYLLKGNTVYGQIGIKYFLKHNFGLALSASGSFGKYKTVEFEGIGQSDRPDVNEYQMQLEFFYKF
jgi:hypothetical protein